MLIYGKYMCIYETEVKTTSIWDDSFTASLHTYNFHYLITASVTLFSACFHPIFQIWGDMVLCDVHKACFYLVLQWKNCYRDIVLLEFVCWNYDIYL